MTHPAVFRPLQVYWLPILKAWASTTFVSTAGHE